MKKRYIFVLICCIVLVVVAICFPKYKRIKYDDAMLGEDLANHLSEDTTVVMKTSWEFSAKMSIYKIAPREISQQEYEQVLSQLWTPEDISHPNNDFTLDGNKITCYLADYLDPSRGYFNMTDAELEKVAWEIFYKLPFLEGEFEYLGIRNIMRHSDSTGEHVKQVGVSFRRTLDGVRVIGDEVCDLYFDGSGLVAVRITAYDYAKKGEMNLLSYEDAYGRVKTPDSFNLSDPGRVKTLEVDEAKILFVNQYSRGCTILQPVYRFDGTAYFEDDRTGAFTARVIAIPEYYTYEDPFN
ncbi:MAG: hypothetical protein IJ448_02105 [Oscillospiraceae bacterium]|nr:hypothetical protein [Oscillospiraceae bacterium]